MFIADSVAGWPPAPRESAGGQREGAIPKGWLFLYVRLGHGFPCFFYNLVAFCPASSMYYK